MSEIILTNTPYDDVFRTMLNDCTSLLIPVMKLKLYTIEENTYKKRIYN